MTSDSSQRVVFHVGAHKTATSLVQKYLRDRPEQVAGNGLVNILRSDANGLVGWGTKLKTKPKLLRNRVLAELVKSETKLVFLSHENTLGRPVKPGREGLYPNARKNLRALREALSGIDVTIVLSIRQQVDFLQSYYLQHIHEGGHQTFEAWLASIDTDNISWIPIADAIVEFFGEQGLCVIDFDTISDGQNAFLKYFFARIAPTLQIEPAYKPVRNPSISAKGLELALMLNPHLATSEERVATRKYLQATFSNRVYSRPKLFSEEDAAGLRQRYRDEYERLTTVPPRIAWRHPSSLPTST